MTAGVTLSGVVFLLGRALFALVVGYLALGNLLDLETSVGYAESKGAPLAGITVPLGSVAMIPSGTAWSLAVGIGLSP